MEAIKDILQKQFSQMCQKTEDSKTGQQFLWANDDKLNEYKHEMPPEPIECEFCKKKLYYRGLMHPFISNTIWKWIAPEPCNCEESTKYRIQEEKKKQEELRQKEEQERKAQEQAKIEKLFEMSKLGERFKSRTFKCFNISEKNKSAFEIAKAFSENFEEAKKNGLGIMFTGTYGTGKTHLACSIAIELINRKIPTIYGTAITLLLKVRQTYDNSTNINEWDLLDLYSNVDLLVIDDLGKEKPSEWVLEKLYHIINQRYENLKPVIITTNYDSVTLINRLSTKDNSSTAEAIVSRLNEMCTGVYMNFEDYRKI